LTKLLPNKTTVQTQNTTNYQNKCVSRLARRIIQP